MNEAADLDRVLADAIANPCAEPANPRLGDVYKDSSTGEVRVYTASAGWVEWPRHRVFELGSSDMFKGAYVMPVRQ